ncbi:hypothetical protein [Polaromonas sp. AET17H-212]|uniref:hypothetical protein n=1 Tax=Polaromonas sp. AET17H-212 TaxID=1977061 RepID=UPI000BBBF0C9|nr:hypothetical protein [Polaromonas sp. AET17H-212]
MLEDLPDVPPAVVLLLVEVSLKSRGDYLDARRRLKALLPELKAQSEVYEAQQIAAPRVAAPPGRMDIYMDGGLNLFDSDASCRSWNCRTAGAVRLARSVGLIADTIWLTDYLTERFCRFGRVTNQKLDEVLADTLVLGELMPLILDGIVKFRTPWIPACPSCSASFYEEVDEIAAHLCKEYAGEFALVGHGGDAYSIGTGDLYSPTLDLQITPSKTGKGSIPSVDTYAIKVAHAAVQSALWVGREAVLGGGSIFSNSKIGLAGLAYKDARARSHSELRLLEDKRSIVVPWVNNLSPHQIVQLRREASKALPTFRETLARGLSPTLPGDSDSSGIDLIDDLRMQAAEVRGELENTRQHANRFWKTAYVTLGFGISAYGVGTDQVMPALGGLLPLLQLLMNHKSGTEAEMEKLHRRPGYVLVKAQDILAHDHQLS